MGADGEHADPSPLPMQRPEPAPIPRLAVARRDALRGGRATVALPGGPTIALFVVDGRVHAIDDGCLRCGESLGAGERVGSLVICTGCGWVYDILTGAVEGVPALRLERFDVSVEDAEVRVALPAPFDDPD